MAPSQHRKNRKPWMVTISMEDFLGLYQKAEKRFQGSV